MSKKVYVAFYYGGGSFIDKMIQWWTSPFKNKWNNKWKSAASHCELSFGSNKWYSASTRMPMEFRVKIMALNPGKWRVYELPITEDDYKRMSQTALSFIGKKYDWLNIFGSDILHLGIHDADKLTCDEGCARILNQSGFYLDLGGIPMLNPTILEQYVKGKVK